MRETSEIEDAQQPDAAKEQAIGVALEQAERYRASCRCEEGIRVLEDAISLGVDSAMIYFRLGNLLIDQGDLGKAEQAYLKAMELDPQHAATANNLAVVYKRTGRIGLCVKMQKRTQRLAVRALLRRGPRRHVEGDRALHRQWGTLAVMALAIAAVVVVAILLR